MDSNETIVQARLGEDEYERFRQVADESGLSLQDALKRAVTEFTARHARHDPDDPFFATLGDDEAHNDEVDDSEDLAARETDSYLYGAK